ncbi:MAG: response regulator [Limnobacter sp.]|uniref:response regulator n=1 Tax=Limnobacter sp. TaxID=2003368 RepID=UPI003001CF32
MNTEHSNPTGTQLGAASKSIRVLVAEDNTVNQTFIAHVLTQLGISFRLVADGVQAVQAVNQEKFDLVLMDFQMPNMGGLEACRRIIAQPGHADLPIVGLTAETIGDIQSMCLAAGMREYISKPFKRSDIEALFARLKFNVSPIPMQNFDHDKELLKTTIDMIAAEIPQLADETEKQLLAMNLSEAKRALHTLKGHCKLVGELAFADFIQQLENQLAQNQLPAADSIEHLKTNLRVLQQRLRLLSQ